MGERLWRIFLREQLDLPLKAGRVFEAGFDFGILLALKSISPEFANLPEWPVRWQRESEGPEITKGDRMVEPKSVPPPSPWLLLVEGRAVCELLSTYITLPILRHGPAGDGHPVMLLPGFLASDLSTTPLRKFLSKQGFSAHGWGLGRNLGPRDDFEERLRDRLVALHEEHGRPVSLVGWSLGGVYARMLANREPERVRSIITLGSPFNHDPRANHSWRLFEYMSKRPIAEVPEETFEQIRNPPPVPSTAVYSRTDGVAAWLCCRDDEDGPLNESIEVPGSHLGLGVNPVVFHLILDRLSQPEGQWQPFERTGLRSFFYPESSAMPAGEAATA